MNATATATLIATLRNAATAASYDNDGYDRHASGRYSGYSAAAGLIEKAGVNLSVVTDLETAANKAAHANDYAGPFEYNPFYVGQASALRAAVETIKKAMA